MRTAPFGCILCTQKSPRKVRALCGLPATHLENGTTGLRELLLNPIFGRQVRYIKGSAMLEKDLFRVAADEVRPNSRASVCRDAIAQAQACFIISNPHAPDIIESDRNSWMRGLVLQHFNPHGKILLLLNASERGPTALSVRGNENM